MKTKTISIVALTFLALAFSACSFSFSTANISSFNFGKNETAPPPATTFDVGEKIYAVANVSNAISKQKIRFKLTFENVQGKGKGETAATKDLDLEGSGSANFFFTAPLPGGYKVEASLIDEQGKETDKKSGTVTVKGSAPAAPAESKKDEDANQHSEDTSDEK